MGDGDAGEELVFVSYSHADAAWAQRFTVLLDPLLRTRRLRLWADTSLRGGDAWRPEIEAAVARSTAALLLVSGDYLASDFVMNHELPALVRRGCACCLCWSASACGRRYQRSAAASGCTTPAVTGVWAATKGTAAGGTSGWWLCAGGSSRTCPA